jgi:hypothetical protein
MHTLTLYGTPEDRIKIEGEFEEEVDAYDMEEGAYLAINDGTLLALAVDENGLWRIDPLTVGIGTKLEKVAATLDSETESDRVTLTNPGIPFQWALMGSSLVSPLEWPKMGSQ